VRAIDNYLDSQREWASKNDLLGENNTNKDKKDLAKR